MQNHRKNLWLMALAGALTIAFASGCPDDDSKGTAGSGAHSGGDLETKNLTYQEITALSETDTYKNKKIDYITISGDKSTVYVVNNAKADIRVLKDPKAPSDKTKWADVAIKGASTNGAGPTVSKVDLTHAGTVRAIHPYQEGAVITTAGGTTANSQGIILMKKDVKEKTYSTDIAALASIQADGGGVAAGNGLLGVAVVASIAPAPGTPTLLALKADGTVGAHVALNVNTVILDGVGSAVPGVGNVVAKAFASGPGINFIAKVGGVDRLAATNTFIPHGVNDYATGKATNEWRHDNAVPNSDINALEFANGNLYVGLNKGVANTGGVVIISGAAAAAGTVVKVDAATKDKTIHAFAARKNGEVFAISDEDIFVFKGAATKPTATYNKKAVDDAKGDDKDGTAKAGWLGDFSMKKMNSAAWLSDDILLVGDNDDGLATINFASKKDVKVKQ